MTNRIIVGERVKALREQKKLSIDELAERSGLSADVINHIETEKTLPALAPLIKISRGLGVRLGTFLDDCEELWPVVSRAGKASAAINVVNGNTAKPEGMNYHALAQQKAGRHLEPFYIELEPDQQNNHDTSAHEGEEFIYVLDGEVEIDYGKTQYSLKKGDSIYFDSIVKHHVHAAGKQEAKVLAVIYTPE